ncbi:MAG: helix-turn-helix domain-containing protein [Agathobacter sp.]|nr:helix-turn-helix domain-containing protein [Agathobacter sp.]
MKEKENMTLGEKIAKQRKELNYTQEQLADILGVSRQSISKWESDIAYPETEKLIELGKIFDCSMDYLLKEDVMEKDGVQNSILSEISKKAITPENKEKTKKILKIVGIIMGVVLAIDIVSMVLYFYVLGFPS